LFDISRSPIEHFHNRNANTTEVLLEVLRQGELRISDQLAMATAADQRAMTFAGLLLVVFALLVGGGVPSLGSVASDFSLVILLVAIFLCIYSAKPTRMFGVGSDSTELTRYLDDSLAGYAVSAIIARNDEAIGKNDTAVKRAARFFRAGMVLAGISFSLVAFDFMYDSASYIAANDTLEKR
jgi:hypothetical protein